MQTPSTGLRHPFLEEGAGKRGLECVTTRMTPALRWAAMRAILMFQ